MVRAASRSCVLDAGNPCRHDGTGSHPVSAGRRHAHTNPIKPSIVRTRAVTPRISPAGTWSVGTGFILFRQAEASRDVAGSRNAMRIIEGIRPSPRRRNPTRRFRPTRAETHLGPWEQGPSSPWHSHPAGYIMYSTYIGVSIMARLKINLAPESQDNLLRFARR